MEQEKDANGKAVKRYYWLKLKEEFFQDKEMKKLRRIAGGDTYTVIYLKLMLLSLKNDGKLYYDGIEDTFYEELALDIDEEPENVRVTLMYLEKMKLIQTVEEDELYLTQMDNLIGSESESAQRVREHRSRQKALQCNTNVTPSNASETKCNTYTEIETETKTNTEKEKKKLHEKEIEDFFESVWKLYPRKEGKSAVNKKAKEEIFNVGYDRMEKCIKRYMEIKQGVEQKYLLHGSTFFNGRYKDYMVEETKKPEPEVEEEEEEMTDEEWLEYMRNLEE